MATQINKNFVDWYQLSTVKPSQDMLIKRWATVEELAANESKGTLLQLVRLVRGSAPLDAPIRTTIVDLARKGDATFSARDNDAELRILAGAALVEILRASSNKSDLVAIALVTATFPGRSEDPLPNEFLVHVRQYLSDEAVRVRAASEPAKMASAEATKPIITAFLEAVSDPATSAKALVAAIAAPVDEATASLWREIEALREESNMFWWVFAGHSRDLDKRFRQLGPVASAIVAPKELADLTVLYPGPRAAHALLARILQDAGDCGNSVKISDAVNSADRTWRQTLIDNYVPLAVREITPLLTATSISLDTDNLTDWISLFTKATGVADIAAPLATIAMQLYLECTLVAASKGMKG